MNTKTLTRVALIAAVYTVISLVLAPLSFGNIQVRFAEALTLLPLIYQPAIAGVTLGCFLTNLIGALMGFNPTGLLDAVIGTAATLIAAIITWRCRSKKVAGLPLISILAPVVLNFFFVGAEVAIGELVAVAVGYLLIGLLSKTKLFTE